MELHADLLYIFYLSLYTNCLKKVKTRFRMAEQMKRNRKQSRNNFKVEA